MNSRARLWASKPQPNDLVLVLHRSLEPAGVKRTCRILLGRTVQDHLGHSRRLIDQVPPPNFLVLMSDCTDNAQVMNFHFLTIFYLVACRPDRVERA
jgi:hypothetical protein